MKKSFAFVLAIAAVNAVGQPADAEPPATPKSAEASLPWRTVRPTYPRSALNARVQGVATIRISTDRFGNVTKVTFLKSINPILDANTRAFALAHWKGPPNSTRTVPVVYAIR